MNISSVKYLDEVDMPKEEYTICKSAILALMGIRDNEDLDILTENEATNGNVESIHPNEYGIDNIEDNSFKVDGYNFLHPKYYFRYKKVPPQGDQNDWERDISDWEGIVKFFEMGKHNQYPFNQLTEEELGVEYLKRYKKAI